MFPNLHYLLQRLTQLRHRLFIIAIFVLIIIVPTVVYTLRNASKASSWWNASWFYRNPVTVSNAGGSLTNHDVLITMDTATQIAAGRMQADCDDIRFTDADDVTGLSYWIEAGCNTSTTQIWVRVPSIPTGSKTIYFYYGNPSATAGQQSWAGQFTLLSSVSCAAGWTRNTSLDSRFPLGSAGYGTTGGTSTHSHANVSCTTGTANGAVSIGTWETGYDTRDYVYTNHTHTGAQVAVNAVSHLPSYLNVFYCSAANLVIPANSIALFSSGPPGGWTRFTSLDSRFPQGSAVYGGTGGASTHTHSTTGGYTTSSVTHIRDGMDSGTYAAMGHYHTTANGSSASGTHTPAYLNVLFGQTASQTTAPSGSIAIVNALPPLGWTRFSALDNRFPQGASSYGATGGGAAHNHSVTITTNGPSNYEAHANWSLDSSVSSHTHTHSCSATTDSPTPAPPYMTVIFAQKNIPSASTSIGAQQTANTAPSAPSSLLAEGQASPTRVIDTTPEFSAVFNDPDTGNTGTYYQVQVNTNSSFTGTVMWDSGQTSMTGTAIGARSPDISYAGSALSLNGATYYWRIRFWDNSGAAGTWSAAANFRMNSTPSAPSSMLAEGQTNPTRVIDTTPEFSAVFNDDDTGDTGTYYQIQVNTASDFTGTSMWDSGQTSMTGTAIGARSPDISYAGSALSLNGATYYWRIRFWDNNSTAGTWSAAANFRMDSTPGAPSDLRTNGLTNPSGINTLTPYFTAIFNDADTGDTGTQYRIQVNTASDFTGTSMWDSGQTSMTGTAIGATSPNLTYAGSPLAFNGLSYYWRVSFWDNSGIQSPWSAAASFSMNTPPAAPTLNAPANTQGGVSRAPTFKATATDVDSDYLRYKIEVCDDSGMTTNCQTFDQTSSQTGWSGQNTQSTSAYTSGTQATNTYTSILPGLTTYYWRASAIDPGGSNTWSSPSTVYSFTTEYGSTVSMEGIRMDGIKID